MFRVSAPGFPATAARRSPGNDQRSAPQDRLLQRAARARQQNAGRCPAYLQPAAKTVSNLSRMNTCTNGAANSRRMRTYKMIGFKAPCNEHLQKNGGGGGLRVWAVLAARASIVTLRSTHGAYTPFRTASKSNQRASNHFRALCSLFCKSSILNSFNFRRVHALFKKHPGGGWQKTWSNQRNLVYKLIAQSTAENGMLG
jgi:hypothetical protein